MDVFCPFCEETGFDLFGLKLHLLNHGWCPVFGDLDEKYSRPETATPSPNIRHDPGLEAGETGE